MSHSYSLWKDVVQPSAVGHSVAAKLGVESIRNPLSSTKFSEVQLVVAKSCFLEVYCIPEGETGISLFQTHRIPLHGNVESLKCIRLPGNDKDAILISSRDAKMSSIVYSAQTDSFHTLALRNYDTLHQTDGRDTHYYAPQLVTDPKGRCAAMLLSPSKIAIVPSDSLEEIGGVQGSKSVQSSAEDTEYGFTKDLEELGIQRIKEIKFLHGYLEPTLVILHEPVYSWEGRFSAKRNTCQLITLSLDIPRSNVSVISSSEMMPLNTFTLIPCPLPIGGVLAISTNVIFHYSQSIDYAFSMNEYGDLHQDFRVNLSLSPMIVAFNHCNGIFLSPFDVLLTVDEGEMYILSMKNQGEAIQEMELSHMGKTQVSSSISQVSEHIYFIGSLLGDSILINIQPLVTSLEDSVASEEDASAQDDTTQKTVSPEDELEIYLFGESLKEEEEKPQISQVSSSYSFTILDSLINLGPISDMVMAPNFIDDSGEKSSDLPKENTFTDMVACSGHGENSVLSILQDGIRPFVLGSFDFEKAVSGSWTLRTDPSSDYDTLVVISFEDSTIVLSSREELRQISLQSGLNCSETTILVSHLEVKEFVAQIVPSGVFLYKAQKDSLKLVQTVSASELVMDESVSISNACISGSHILVLLDDGSVQLLRFNSSSSSISVSESHFQWPESISSSKVTAMSLYKNSKRGLFKRRYMEQEQDSPTEEERSETEIAQEVDTMDLEEYFYGGTSEIVKEDQDQEMQVDGQEDVDVEDVEGTTFEEDDFIVVLCRLDGTCGIFGIPSFELLFWIPNLPAGFSFTDNGMLKQTTTDFAPFEDFHVEQVLMTDFDHQSNNPFLIISLSNNDILIYQCIVHYESHVIPMALSKFNHGLMMRSADGSFHQKLKQRVFQFTNISGLKGVYISGNRPAWLIHERGTFFEHYQAVRGQSSVEVGRGSFTCFNSDSCNDGFISFLRGSLQICQLPDPEIVRLDHQCPVRRVKVGKTARWICYHKQSDTYSVVVSEKEESYGLEEVTERSLKVWEEKFHVYLYTSSSFNHVETYSDIPANEIILCVNSCQLWDFTKNRMSEFISIGTTIFEGEDVLCRGRVVLLDIYDSTPSDLSGAGMGYKKIYDQTERASVTNIAEVMNVLAICVGARVIIYKMIDARLVGVAFYDSQLYPVSVSTVKNFLIVGDVCKGIVFLYWEPEMKQLIFLGKDFDVEEVYSTALLPDNNTLKLITSDAQGNLRIFAYSPEHPGSRGGEKLLSRADFHIGTRITRFIPLMCRETNLSALAQQDKTRMDAKAHSFLAVGCSIDGSLGYVVSVDELVYRRLYSLHTQMTYRLPHCGGLNPRMFRTYQTTDQRKYEIHRNVVDGNLLWEFKNLDYFKQLALARNLGTKPGNILQNLLEVDLSTRLF